MKINANAQNLAETFDLTENELNAFYKGAGKVCILVDAENNILAAKYKDGRGAAEFDAVENYEDYKDGMFSANQFVVA